MLVAVIVFEVPLRSLLGLPSKWPTEFVAESLVVLAVASEEVVRFHASSPLSL